MLVGGRVEKSILMMTFDEPSYFECIGMNFACHLFKITESFFTTQDVAEV